MTAPETIVGADLTLWQKAGDRIAFWIFVNLWTPAWPDWLGLWLVERAGRYAYAPRACPDT